MFLIPKVLKRKDASSVIVAIVLGLILLSLIQAWSMQLSYVISGLDDVQSGADWKVRYLQPGVMAAVQVVFLELVLRLWTIVKDALNSK